MAVVVESVGPGQTDAFASIWVPWLRDSFGAEPVAEDLEIMADPSAYYRMRGGEAFLASLGGEVVGGVAVKRLGPSGFEFGKLLVIQRARGNGVGRLLIEACLAFAGERGGPALYLQSARSLKTALELYRLLGFLEVKAPADMQVLARTEVVMARQVA